MVQSSLPLSDPVFIATLLMRGQRRRSSLLLRCCGPTGAHGRSNKLAAGAGHCCSLRCLMLIDFAVWATTSMVSFLLVAGCCRLCYDCVGCAIAAVAMMVTQVARGWLGGCTSVHCFLIVMMYLHSFTHGSFYSLMSV